MLTYAAAVWGNCAKSYRKRKRLQFWHHPKLTDKLKNYGLIGKPTATKMAIRKRNRRRQNWGHKKGNYRKLNVIRKQKQTLTRPCAVLLQRLPAHKLQEGLPPCIVLLERVNPAPLTPFKFPIKSRIFYLPSQHPPLRDLRVMVTSPKLEIIDKHEMLEELRYNKAAAEVRKLACLA